MVRSHDQIVYLNEQIRNKAANISVQTLFSLQQGVRAVNRNPTQKTAQITSAWIRTLKGEHCDLCVLRYKNKRSVALRYFSVTFRLI